MRRGNPTRKEAPESRLSPEAVQVPVLAVTDEEQLVVAEQHLDAPRDALENTPAPGSEVGAFAGVKGTEEFHAG